MLLEGTKTCRLCGHVLWRDEEEEVCLDCNTIGISSLRHGSKFCLTMRAADKSQRARLKVKLRVALAPDANR